MEGEKFEILFLKEKEDNKPLFEEVFSGNVADNSITSLKKNFMPDVKDPSSLFQRKVVMHDLARHLSKNCNEDGSKRIIVVHGEPDTGKRDVVLKTIHYMFERDKIRFAFYFDAGKEAIKFENNVV